MRFDTATDGIEVISAAAHMQAEDTFLLRHTTP